VDMSLPEDELYNTVITIVNSGDNELTDYQVLIELDSTNFDFTKTTSDGRDIRVYDYDLVNKLSFWIEEWDTANQIGKIWVKIPNIPAGDIVKIQLLYGNSNLTSESDPNNTFDFYDDFLNLDNWRIVRIGGDGYAKAEDSYLKIYSTDEGTVVDTPITLSNVVVDAKVYVVDNGENFTIILGQGKYDASGRTTNGYEDIWNGWPTETKRQRIRKYVNGSITTLAQTANGLLENNLTYILSMLFYSPNIKMLNNYDKILAASDSAFNQLSYLGLRCWTSAEYWIDWVRVRKYSVPEPIVLVGDYDLSTFSHSFIGKELLSPSRLENPAKMLQHVRSLAPQRIESAIGRGSCSLNGWTIITNKEGSVECTDEQYYDDQYSAKIAIPPSQDNSAWIAKPLDSSSDCVIVTAYVYCASRDDVNATFPDIRFIIPDTEKGCTNYDDYSDDEAYIYLTDGSRVVVPGIGAKGTWHKIKMIYSKGYVYVYVDDKLIVDKLDVKTTKPVTEVRLGGFSGGGGLTTGYIDKVEIKYTS